MNLKTTREKWRYAYMALMSVLPDCWSSKDCMLLNWSGHCFSFVTQKHKYFSSVVFSIHPLPHNFYCLSILLPIPSSSLSHSFMVRSDQMRLRPVALLIMRRYAHLWRDLIEAINAREDGHSSCSSICCKLNKWLKGALQVSLKQQLEVFPGFVHVK